MPDNNIYSSSATGRWSTGKAKEAKVEKKEDVNKVNAFMLRLDTGEENKFVFNGKKHFDMFTEGGLQFIRMADKQIHIVIPTGGNVKPQPIASINQTSNFPIGELHYLEPTQGRLNYQGHNIMFFKQKLRNMSGKNNEVFVCFAWSETQVLYMESSNLQTRIGSMKGIIQQLLTKMLIPDAFKFILQRKDF